MGARTRAEASGRERHVSWALKGKSMMLWHGEPQDVSATDRMTVDKEGKQGFIFGGRAMDSKVAGRRWGERGR